MLLFRKEATRMSKQMKWLVLIVLASAMVMIVSCSLNYLHLNSELTSCRSRLAESLSKWQVIAAEKESLQEDLKAKQKELKIAQVSLEEASEDAETIRAEIDQYRSDIELLKQKGTENQ